LKSLDDIRQALAAMDLTISRRWASTTPMLLPSKRSSRSSTTWHSIGDLIPVQSEIKAAFSYEFMDRKDGYPGLVGSYA